MRDAVKLVSDGLFFPLTFVLASSFLLEAAWEGSILAHFNLNYLLILWLLNATLLVCFSGKHTP